MSRYSITIELDANSMEEAVSLVAVGEIVEALNLDMLMWHPSDIPEGDEQKDGEDVHVEHRHDNVNMSL